VVTTLVSFFIRTRGCGCVKASGFPCALCFWRGVVAAMTWKPECFAGMRRCVLELRGFILRNVSLVAMLLRMRSEQALVKKYIHFQRVVDPSAYLVPTFRSSCSIAAPAFANFGKSWALADLLILVPLCRSEVPDRIRRLWCRDFRSAVLDGRSIAPAKGPCNADNVKKNRGMWTVEPAAIRSSRT
jgi:hypothetical protein